MNTALLISEDPVIYIIHYTLQQWFSTRGILPGTLAVSRKTWVITTLMWGLAYYQNLVGKHQGCCYISYSPQDSPHNTNHLAPNDNSA